MANEGWSRRAFWSTLFGGVLGGAPGLYLGGIIGFALPWQSEGFDGFLYAIYGAAVGCWLGVLAGAWLLLRLTRVEERRSIVKWLALIAPVVVGPAAWVSGSMTDTEDFGSPYFPYVLFVTSVIATAFLAVRLGNRT